MLLWVFSWGRGSFKSVVTSVATLLSEPRLWCDTVTRTWAPEPVSPVTSATLPRGWHLSAQEVRLFLGWVGVCLQDTSVFGKTCPLSESQWLCLVPNPSNSVLVRRAREKEKETQLFWVWPSLMTNLALPSSKIELHSHHIVATRTSVTTEGLSKVHEETFTKI